MADKINLPRLTRNVYRGPIDYSAPAEVYRRPNLKYNPPRANLLNQTYSIYKRFKSNTNRNTTNNSTNSSAAKKNTTNNTTSKKYSSPNAVINTNLPDVYVTGTRRNTTNNTTATAKPATIATSTNNTSSQKQTTAPATRRTNTTRRPARLANRNESKVNGNTVKVKAGDTLYAIAKRLTGDGNNYKEFLKYNDIKDANKIYAGDNLVIPEKFRKIKSNSERRNADNYAERLRRVKERANFTLPDNLDEDYAQLQPREGGRRTLETAGRY